MLEPNRIRETMQTLATGGLLAGALLAGPAAASAPQLVSVRTTPLGAAPASLDRPGPAVQRISDDGRLVVFESADAAIAPDQLDENDVLDVFLYDRQAGSVRLVSHVPGAPATAADAGGRDPSISGDGSTIVFRSDSTDLIGGGSGFGSISNIFAFDVASGTVSLLSHAHDDPLSSGNGPSSSPATGLDGTVVAFLSSATNLVDGFADGNGPFAADVFVATPGGVLLASRASGTTTDGGDDRSEEPAVSRDGSTVVFRSDAQDLVAGFVDHNGSSGNPDLFRFVVGSGELALVDHLPGSPAETGNRRVQEGAFDVSADGSVIVFESGAGDLVAGQVDVNGSFGSDVFRYDVKTDTISLVSHAAGDTTRSGDEPSGAPSLSHDGCAVAFESEATDLATDFEDLNDGGRDVFVLDACSPGSEAVVASHLPGLPSFGAELESFRPYLSGDGSRLAFLSDSRILASGQDDENEDIDLFLFEMATGTVRLVTFRNGAPATTAERGVEGSRGPFLAANGSVVAFDSAASDLFPGATGDFAKVVAHDVASGINELASRRPADRPIPDVEGASGPSSVSDDGSLVVFVSGVSRAVEGQDDRNELTGRDDVFLFDRGAGAIRLVSHVPSDPLRTGDSASSEAVVSRDGSCVVFVSRATDLVAGMADPAFRHQVFLYRTGDGTVELVSHRHDDPLAPGDGDSGHPRVSADCGVVAFESRATDLVSGSVSGSRDDVFVWTNPGGSPIALASHRHDDPTASASGHSDRPVVSPDGSAVFFESRANAADLIAGATDANGTSRDVFRYDVTTGTNLLVSHVDGAPTTTGDGASTAPASDATGGRAAFLSSATDLVAGQSDGNGADDVFRWSAGAPAVELVSRSTTGPTTAADGGSQTPRIDDGGERVVFASSATDLVAGVTDPNGGTDVYFFDLVEAAAALVSHAAGAPAVAGDALSAAPSISADGTVIVFESLATDLAAGVEHAAALRAVYRVDVPVSGGGAPDAELVSHRFDDPAVAIDTAFTSDLDLDSDGGTIVFGSGSPAAVAGASGEKIVLVSGPDLGADLALSVDDLADPVMASETVVLLADVQNLDGLSGASHTAVAFAVPPGVASIEGSGDGWTCGLRSGTVTCRRAAVAAGDAAPTLTLEMTAPASAGEVDAELRVFSISPELDPLDDEAAETTTILGLDFGDAPDPAYPTLLASDGARHAIVGPTLGGTVDGEPDGQPTAASDGDDVVGPDDEDGIAFGTLRVGQAATVTVEAPAGGVLDAWIDWDGDGGWAEPAERIFDGEVLVPGSQPLSLIVPPTAAPGASVARFRLSSAGGLGPSGPAPDGEVEDHPVTVTSAADLELGKSDGDVVASPGGELVYHLTVTNHGPSPSSGGTITDVLPGDLGFGSSSDGCSAAFVGPDEVVTCAFADLEPGTQTTLSFSAIVAADPSPSIHNSATVAGPEHDPVAENDTDEETTPTDGVAPTVVSAAAIPGGPIDACTALTARPSSLEMGFSEPLLDPPGTGGPGDVSSPASYLLVAPGADADFDTGGCIGPVFDDPIVPITGALWNVASRVVSLPLAAPLPTGRYRLLACDALKDLAANALDGDGDGTAGGDFRLDFRVDEQNLFANGSFDCDVAGWEVVGATPVHDPTTDVDGASGSGSAALAGTTITLTQCVELPGRVLELSGASFFEVLAGPATIGLSCEGFAGAGCGGATLGVASRAIERTKTSIWLPFHADLELDGTTSSARCGATITSPSHDVRFDALRLEAVAPVFADGFESGDTAAWGAPGGRASAAE